MKQLLTTDREHDDYQNLQKHDSNNLDTFTIERVCKNDKYKQSSL